MVPGNIFQDNNLLLADQRHVDKVITMLQRLNLRATFAGGLDASLLTDSFADQLRGLKIGQIFLACDTDDALDPLARAISKLRLPMQKLRCYVLLGFYGESLEKGVRRFMRVWELGVMPFAQLYQPPNEYIKYPHRWREVARTWSRPAAMKSLNKLSTAAPEEASRI